MNFTSQIMKVKLAAQTFSASVSKALEFVSQLGLPQFRGCDGTAKFVSMVDRYASVFLILLHNTSKLMKCFRLIMKLVTTAREMSENDGANKFTCTALCTKHRGCGKVQSHTEVFIHTILLPLLTTCWRGWPFHGSQEQKINTCNPLFFKGGKNCT